MKLRSTLLLMFCAVLFWGAHLDQAPAQTELTYAQLVKRLIDLERLAVLPAPGEQCAQWSSWDRASQFDAERGVYVRWDANDDGPGFIRQEGDQIVMAEMDGPGCIFRIWSALAEKGHVKIYLDGKETPVVDLPFEAYFRGDTEPFHYPQLSYNLAEQGCRGQNLYFPIPYQKSCKIVADKGWGRYYHFVYTTYPEGTKLPTFDIELARRHAADLQRVDDFLSGSLGQDPAGDRPGQIVERGTVDVAPGAAAVLDLPGPRAITGIRGKVRTATREDQMAAMRKLTVKITFDDQQRSSVWCPLGDFFGTAPGENHYRSLVTGMTDDNYYAYWYMPFVRGATIELANEDEVDRQVEYEIVHAPLSRPWEELGYFHYKWHRDAHTLSEDRWPDWVMLQTAGRGRFCGVMLHVWNPQGGWWGEGDEKFFVDGEKFPSTFGTGSEDYFGYAWCHPGLFERAFHCQTMTQDNRGHQSVLRWHVADNVPFQESFEASIEKYYRLAEKGTKYACTVAWYLAPGGDDRYDPVSVEQRHDYYDTPPLTAGGFRVLGRPPGNVETQGLAGRPGGRWHNDDHLWWTSARPGDRLEVVLPVELAGTYKVHALLTKARDYGIVQLYLDGKTVGEPVDLYDPEVVPTGRIALGTHTLSAGDHTLAVEIVGANEKAIKQYMFGLDQIELQPVD